MVHRQYPNNEVARADQELNQLINTLVMHRHTIQQQQAILNQQSATLQQPQQDGPKLRSLSLQEQREAYPTIY